MDPPLPFQHVFGGPAAATGAARAAVAAAPRQGAAPRNPAAAAAGAGQEEQQVLVLPSAEKPRTLQLHWKYDPVFINHIKDLSKEWRAWNPTKKTWDIPESGYNLVAAHMRTKGYRLMKLFGDDSDAPAAGGTPGASSSRPAAAAAVPATPVAGPATPAAAPAPAAGRVTPAAVNANQRSGGGSSSSRVKVPLLTDEQVGQIIWDNVPLKLWDYLKPYQREGVQYAVKREGRMLLADAPGLGKTIQAITVAICYRGDWPLLVVTPASMKDTWAKELKKRLGEADMLPEERYFWQPKTGDALDKLVANNPLPPGFSKHVLIISYDLLKKRLPPQLQDRYGVIICDECHALKKGSGRTKFMVPLVQRAKRALLLSGTPVTSRPIEAYYQVDMLRPGLLGSYDEYGKRYCQEPNWRPSAQGFGFGGQFWQEDPYRGRNSARMPELEALLSANVMMRRQKTQIRHEVPDKKRQRLPIHVTSDFLTRCHARKERLVIKGLPHADPRMQNAIMWWWRTTGFAKAVPVMERLTRHLLQLEERHADAARAAVMAAAAAAEAAAAANLAAGRAPCGDRRERSGAGQNAGSSKRQRLADGTAAAAPAAAAAEDSDDDSSSGGEGARAARRAAARHAAGGPPQQHRGVKCLVFAHHRRVLDVLEEGVEGGLGAAGYIRIDGNTPVAQRQPLVDRFQSDPSCRVALLSMGAAGEGLTLTAARAVLFAELPWTPAAVMQAEDRAHRLGQKFELNVYYVVAEGSADDMLWGNLSNKLTTVDMVLDGGRGPGGGGGGKFTRAGNSTWSAAEAAAARAAANEQEQLGRQAAQQHVLGGDSEEEEGQQEGSDEEDSEEKEYDEDEEELEEVPHVPADFVAGFRGAASVAGFRGGGVAAPQTPLRPAAAMAARAAASPRTPAAAPAAAAVAPGEPDTVDLTQSSQQSQGEEVSVVGWRTPAAAMAAPRATGGGAWRGGGAGSRGRVTREWVPEVDLTDLADDWW